MTAPMYGLCPICRQWFALRKSGRVRQHRRDGRWVCAGSLQEPEVDQRAEGASA